MPGPQETSEMQHGVPHGRPRLRRVRIRKLAAAMLGVAAVSNCWFVLALILPATLPPGNTFISELAARGQPYSTIFRLADLVTGLTLIIGVILGWSRAPMNRWLWMTGAALAGYGLLTATDSLLPLDCPPSWDPACRAAELAGTVSWQHQLHSLTGVLETVAILVACAGVRLGTGYSRHWWPVHKLAGWLAVVQMTIAALISILWLAEISAVGWPQRIATLATSALLVALARQLAVAEWDPAVPPEWPACDPTATLELTATVFPRDCEQSPATESSSGYSFASPKAPTRGSPDGSGADGPRTEQPDQLTLTIYRPADHRPDPNRPATNDGAAEPASTSHRPGATVLFLNGLSLPADLWQPVIASVRPTTEAVCFDRPGIGTSSGTSGPDLNAQLAQIRAVLATACPPASELSRVLLVAHSHAALAATTMARMHPELVGGLVLVDPSVPGQPHRLTRAAQAAVVALLRSGTRLRWGVQIVGRCTTWLQLRAGLATPDCYWPPRHLRAQMASLPRLRAAVAELAIEPTVLSQESDAARRLPLPAIPVALLASQRVGWPTYFPDRGWTKRLSAYANHLRAQGAAVDFQVLPGAHLLLLDVSAELARIVTEMSQRIA